MEKFEINIEQFHNLEECRKIIKRVSKRGLINLIEWVLKYRAYEVLLLIAAERPEIKEGKFNKKIIDELHHIEKLLSEKRVVIPKFSSFEEGIKKGLFNPRFDKINDICIAKEYGIIKLEDIIYKINSTKVDKFYKSKIVVFSDTHGYQNFSPPDCDILICCGDVIGDNDKYDYFDFMGWFSRQNSRYKVYIPGNHDKVFWETEDFVPKNIICLNGKGVILTEENIKIYGLSASVFNENKLNNSFALHRRNSRLATDLIPSDTDILITHGPPFGIGDLNMTLLSSCESGDYSLRSRLYSLKLKYHFFGHCHSGKGAYKSTGINTIFVNVSQSIFSV